ncbi:PEP-CTERM sorting domain-containing protein [Pannus brasiliensis CCIBt3594]|uniref:PEP-CTERM sorting domain-containing protein n=1 Tax=Pannus brasiliensis CCIBt3594 TaxID=1427578 RepID=A0AAW9QUZ2_9CHRO
MTSLTVAGVSATALFGSEPARAALVYDNIGAPANGSSSYNISNFAQADDFTLTKAARLTDFTFWASYPSGNSSNLSDNIGWAIFNNNAGAVGSLIASGTDTSVTKTVTGVNTALGDPIIRVDGDFGGTISLAAGTYWISFRDGAWGSFWDGTDAFWTGVSPSIVGNPARSDSNERNPTFPTSVDRSYNFRLFDNFVPPPIVPEPGTIAGLLAVGVVGAFARVRKA